MKRVYLKGVDLLKAHSGTFAGWFQQGAGAVAALACVPLYVRFLGNEQTGVWLAFQALAMAATLTDFGFGFVTSRQVAFSLGGHSGSKAGTDIDTRQVGWQGVANTLLIARQLNLWSCAAAFVVMAALGWYVTGNPRFHLLPFWDLATVWLVLSLSIVVTLWAKPDFALLEGGGQLPVTRIISGLQLLVAALGGVLAVLLGGGMRAMAMMSLFAAAGATLSLRLFANRLLAPHGKNPDIPTRTQRRHMLKVALPLGVVNFGSYCFSSIQVPLIAALLSPSLVASFYLAQKGGQFLNIAVLQYLLPKMPRFSALLSAGDQGQARQMMGKTLKIVAGASLLSLGLFVFVMPPVAKYLLHVELPASPVIGMMGLDFLILNCSVCWGYFVLASGKNPFLVPTLITGVLNLVLLHFLLPIGGLICLPLASLAAGLLCIYWVNIVCGVRLYHSLKT